MLQVLAAKYPETLKAIQNALESKASLVPLLHWNSNFLTWRLQLEAGATVEVISVSAPISNSSRRLLQATNNTIVAVLSVSATAANTNNFNPQTAAANIPAADLQVALTAQLKVLNVGTGTVTHKTRRACHVITIY
jgi:hypothetical protein